MHSFNVVFISQDQSSDGTKKVGVVDGGFVYTSTDSGKTWTKRTTPGSVRGDLSHRLGMGVRLSDLDLIGLWDNMDRPGSSNKLSMVDRGFFLRWEICCRGMQPRVYIHLSGFRGFLDSEDQCGSWLVVFCVVSKR